MQWLPVFKVVDPLSLYIGNLYIISKYSVKKIDINLVTTGHGDINAKKKKKKKTILIFTNQIMEKNNTAYRYSLVLLNTSFGNKDPLVRNVCEKY